MLSVDLLLGTPVLGVGLLLTCAGRRSIPGLSKESPRRLVDGVGDCVRRVGESHMHARPPPTPRPALPHHAAVHHAVPSVRGEMDVC